MTKRIKVALAGNPNSGKSTVFNNPTGARQHVWNYPGVTVEKKEGSLTHGESPFTASCASSSRKDGGQHV